MPGERFDANGHGSGTREIVNVISGSLALEIDGQTAIVGAGSSAIARTDRPHAYRNPGNSAVRFTMVVHEPPVSS